MSRYLFPLLLLSSSALADFDAVRESPALYVCETENGEELSRHNTDYRAVIDCGALVDADGVDRYIQPARLRLFKTDRTDPEPDDPEPTTTIELRWKAPTEFEDGAPLSPDLLAEFRVYRGETLVAKAGPAATSIELEQPLGTHAYEMTAVLTNGTESKRSNRVTR